MFIVLVCASLGMAGLYVQNPQQFWLTVDSVDQYLKPVGSNIIWPDFQVSLKSGLKFSIVHNSIAISGNSTSL